MTLPNTEPNQSPRQLSALEFQREYGEAPRWTARAPGRVNLIGEHTDYNEGFVLPIAIDRETCIAARPTGDRKIRLRSLDRPNALEFSLDRIERGGDAWGEYVKGVAWALTEMDHDLAGWEGVIASSVPIGAGLSSSAALEMAVARMFCGVSNLPWDTLAMARIGRRAENDWVGAPTGIMDQLISAAAVAGHALLIDCRSLDLARVPLVEGTCVLILDTMTRHDHAGSEYQERRNQCETASGHLNLRSLRDINSIQLLKRGGDLDAVILRRARHVVSENERTIRVADALRQGDAQFTGLLMNQSHASMRDDFEITNPELDLMVELAQSLPGCHGARMTGGGFGGCVVALVETACAEQLANRIAADYESRTGVKPGMYACMASDGASILEVDA